MTKNEELDLLKQIVENYPEESYLRGPLKALIPFIENEIRSDFEPDIIGAIKNLEEEKALLKNEIKELQEEHLKLHNANVSLKRELEGKQNQLEKIYNTARDILSI